MSDSERGTGRLLIGSDDGAIGTATDAHTHTGEGVARRAVSHARRRAEAESDVDDAAMLQEEARRDNVRLVPAEEVEV